MQAQRRLAVLPARIQLTAEQCRIQQVSAVPGSHCPQFARSRNFHPCQHDFWTWVCPSMPTSPSTSEASRVFSKNFTATSPVTTPIFSVSAAENNWPKRRRSSGLRWRLGCSRIENGQLPLSWHVGDEHLGFTYAAPHVAATPRPPCPRGCFAVRHGERVSICRAKEEAQALHI